MFQVVKRDGQMDEFKIGKITSAIDKAFKAQEKNYSKEMIDLLGLRVTADFQNKIKDNKISVEEILEQNKEKAEEKRVKRGEKNERIAAMAQMNTKNMNNQNQKKRQSTSNLSEKEREAKVENAHKKAENAKKGSLASKANMVKKFNEND